MAHTESEGGIDMFGGGDTFFKDHDGFVEHGHEDGIRDEARGVCRESNLCVTCELKRWTIKKET